HFQSHKGAAQAGSYHGISGDGLNFNRVQDIVSDAAHNWLGNYVVVDTTLRFYGNGQQGIWFNTSYNGGSWNGYVNTNINGGDPAVVQNQAGKFYIIYTGNPYNTASSENESENNPFDVFPNPATGRIIISVTKNKVQNELTVFNMLGE